MASEIGTNAQRIELAKAVIASFAAQRTGAQLTGEIQDLSLTPVPDFLTLSPYFPLGYPMTAQVLVLERLALGEQLAEAGEEATGLTNEDLLISQATAFLFDRLINPILPFGPVAPRAFERQPMNEPYEQALRGAQFAGSVEDPSAELLAAEAVLRRTDESGELVFTEEYLVYRDFADRVQAAQDQLATLSPDASPTDREAAQREVERLQAEWLAVGHKELIEDAFQTIHDAGQESGFGHERVRLIDQLEAFERLRLDAVGQTYVESQLVPLAPLLATVEDRTGWERVDLDADAIRETLQPDARGAFDLSEDDVEAALAGLRKLTFEMTTCGVVRDWFDKDFVNAHFWRLPSGDLLSDGHGGGKLPGYASQVIFVRGVRLEYFDELIALFGDEPQATADLRPRILRLVSDDVATRAVSVGTALEAAQQTGLSKAAAVLKSEHVQLAAPGAKLLHVSAATFANGATSEPRTDTPVATVSRSQPGIMSTLRAGVGQLASLRRTLGDRSRVRVRDHRGERPRIPRPRVRDHRDRDDHSSTTQNPREREGYHWVPEHREQGRLIRGHWERDRASHRVQFSIEISADDGALPDGISLEGLKSDGEQIAFNLRRESAEKLVGEQEVRLPQNEAAAAELTLVLHDGKGGWLDQQLIRPDDDDSVDLRWTVKPELITLELTNMAIPTLFGYALTIVPRCPTPDPTLDWS